MQENEWKRFEWIKTRENVKHILFVKCEESCYDLCAQCNNINWSKREEEEIFIVATWAASHLPPTWYVCAFFIQCICITSEILFAINL